MCNVRFGIKLERTDKYKIRYYTELGKDLNNIYSEKYRYHE